MRLSRMEHTKIIEHAAATRDETSTQWNRRRMIKNAKVSGHYRPIRDERLQIIAFLRHSSTARLSRFGIAQASSTSPA